MYYYPELNVAHVSEAGNIPSYSLSKGLYFCYNHTSAAPDPVTLSAQRGTQHAVTLHKVIKKQLANNMHICCGADIAAQHSPREQVTSWLQVK